MTFIVVNTGPTHFSFQCYSTYKLFILVGLTYVNFNISLKNDKLVIRTCEDFNLT